MNRQRSIVDWILLAIIAVSLSIAAYGVYLYLFQPATLVLTWSTENEIDILGFNVYRATVADGEYALINESPIPASDTLLGTEHQYFDENVEKGVTYYYKLETLFRDGRSELSTAPVILPPP